MDLMEIEWEIVDWMHVAQNIDQWWGFVETIKGGEFLD
jgi:hypothetical protein